MSVDELLSRAVGAFVTREPDGFPHLDPSSLEREFGAAVAAELRPRLEALVVEMMALSFQGNDLLAGTRAAESIMKQRHPELDPEAVAALGFYYSYCWRQALSARIAPTSLAAMAADTDRQYPAGGHLSVRTRSVPGLTPEVVETLYAGAETFTSRRSLVALQHFHGAGARVPVQDTAVVLRTPHLMAELVAQWEPGDPRIDQHLSWVEELSQDLAPLALPGGYVNILAPDSVDQVPRAYGPNTARLLAIKARFDPEHVFAATPMPEPARAGVPGMTFSE